MIDVILRTATRALMPLMLGFSVFLLIRGHNEPGGGFAGGLVAAVAFVLYAFAFDVRDARRVLRIEPTILMGVGLSAAAGAGLIGLATGETFLTGHWATLNPIGLKLGTPLLFDLGVYLSVFGAALAAILTLAEE
jgi:multicomponent Na+:H+ antiporter subunit B